MTPSEFRETLPMATKSRFYDRARANEAVRDGSCKLHVAGRKYTAPIGFTLSDDVRYGALGVDEWVGIDNGNAYALNGFEWISVGDKGATQLLVYFDTMLCK
jgi:hypothetical protein